MPDSQRYPKRIQDHVPEFVPERVRAKGYSAVRHFRLRAGMEFTLMREKEVEPLKAEQMVERVIVKAMEKKFGEAWQRKMN
jgi:hypothetical protein